MRTCQQNHLCVHSKAFLTQVCSFWYLIIASRQLRELGKDSKWMEKKTQNLQKCCFNNTFYNNTLELNSCHITDKQFLWKSILGVISVFSPFQRQQMINCSTFFSTLHWLLWSEEVETNQNIVMWLHLHQSLAECIF